MKKIPFTILFGITWLWLNLWITIAEDIQLSTNKTSPSTNQFVNLTIETDDDYTGKLTFSAKYRSSSSASWTTISNLKSSTYFSDYSDEWENGYYKMKSSDNGEKTLKNLVKFKKKGYYRIYVKNTDWNQEYIQFSVAQNNSNSNLKLSLSPSSPDSNEWIKLTIETDDDYVWKINFTKLQYKSNSSASWSSISKTSNTYISNYSTQWNNGYYKMTSSDNGEKTISKFIKFKKKGYYRIFAEDIDGNTTYVQINVSTSSSSNSSDDITLSVNDKTPSTNQFVNLIIETDDDYTGKLTFSAKYRSSSSASWTTISNLKSSTYFLDYSDEWENGYYKMKSSDNGEKTLKNLVKFKKKGYYRIYVKDTKWNQNYIQFTVWDGNLPNDGSNINWFTNSELDKIKQTYKTWNSMIAQTQRQYPRLKKDTYWKTLSSNLYDDMEDVIKNKSARDFDDYDNFKQAFDDWYKYTMRNI